MPFILLPKYSYNQITIILKFFIFLVLFLHPFYPLFSFLLTFLFSLLFELLIVFEHSIPFNIASNRLKQIFFFVYLVLTPDFRLLDLIVHDIPFPFNKEIFHHFQTFVFHISSKPNNINET